MPEFLTTQQAAVLVPRAAHPRAGNSRTRPPRSGLPVADRRHGARGRSHRGAEGTATASRDFGEQMIHATPATGAVWPAPPAPLSPWEAAMAPRSAARSAARPADRRGEVRIDEIEGTALFFGRWITKRLMPTLVPMMVKRGALDRQLRRIASGESLPLRLGHSGPLLCTTRDALAVWVRGDRLWIRVAGAGPVGREALRRIRDRGWGGLSIGGEGCGYVDRDDRVVYTRMRLYEIAVVKAPGCVGAGFTGGFLCR